MQARIAANSAATTADDDSRRDLQHPSLPRAGRTHRCRLGSPTSSGPSIPISSRSRRSSAPARTRRATPRSSGRCSAWAGSWRRRATCAAACSATSSSAAIPIVAPHALRPRRGRPASRAAASVSTWPSATTSCTSTTCTSGRRSWSGAIRPGASRPSSTIGASARPKVVLGDFNEWMKGLATSTLNEQLQSIDLRAHLRRRRTYPGVFPVLHLDHIYYEGQVEVVKVELPRTRLSLHGVGPSAAGGGAAGCSSIAGEPRLAFFFELLFLDRKKARGRAQRFAIVVHREVLDVQRHHAARAPSRRRRRSRDSPRRLRETRRGSRRRDERA